VPNLGAHNLARQRIVPADMEPATAHRATRDPPILSRIDGHNRYEHTFPNTAFAPAPRSNAVGLARFTPKRTNRLYLSQEMLESTKTAPAIRAAPTGQRASHSGRPWIGTDQQKNGRSLGANLAHLARGAICLS